MKLEKWHYERVAERLHELYTKPPKPAAAIEWHEMFDSPTAFIYDGELVAKERPRSKKNGAGTYTPARTRKFEAAVNQAAKLWMEGEKPVAYPIRCKLIIYDHAPTTDALMLSLIGAKFDLKKDLDNVAKAVLDGCNKALWYDDKQIVNLMVSRRYASMPGFTLKMWRAGMTDNEITTMLGTYRSKYGKLPDR